MRPHVVTVLSTALLLMTSLGAQDLSELHLVPTCPSGTKTIKTIKGCKDEGCGGVADAGLNLAKNRTDAPAPAPEMWSVADVLDLFEPDDWLTGQDRDEIANNEGTPVRLVAYIKTVRAEGKETCNCGLTKRPWTDVHLAMVDKKNDDESDSITAEITPRIRASDHPDWTYVNIKKLEGKFVRLTGWLMLDTAHAHHSKWLKGELPLSGLNRATNWEVHPVTRVEVCASTMANCRQNVGWKDATFPKKPNG